MRRVVTLFLVLLFLVSGVLIVRATTSGERYDENHSGFIESPEAVDAIHAYFAGEITQAEALDVWMRHYAGVHVTRSAPPTPTVAVPTLIPTATNTPYTAPTPTPTPSVAEPIRMLNCRKREHDWFYGVSIHGSASQKLVVDGILKYIDVTFINPSEHPFVWSYGFLIRSNPRDAVRSYRSIEVTKDGEWMVRTYRGSISSNTLRYQFTIHDRGYFDEIGVPFNTGGGERNQLTLARGFFVNGHEVLGEVPGLQTYIATNLGRVHYENLCTVYAEDDWKGDEYSTMS